MAKQHTRVGTVGTCPVCDREYRVQKGVMVHHGYERPGHGSIVGDCWAVGREPFEVSCEATKEYRKGIDAFLHDLREHHVRLTTGVTTMLRKDVSKYEYKHGRKTLVEAKFEEYTSSETDPLRAYEWKQLLHYAVLRVESEVRMAEAEVGRLDKMVARWEPKPLREVTEEVLLREKSELGARKAARAAAAQAKRDEEHRRYQERLAKEKAEEDREKAFYAEWGQKFADLALADGRLKARGLQEEMRAAAKKAKLRFHYKDHVAAFKMKQDKALVALGLAYHRIGGHYDYVGFN